jgi:hypothetical protein
LCKDREVKYLNGLHDDMERVYLYFARVISTAYWLSSVTVTHKVRDHKSWAKFATPKYYSNKNVDIPSSVIHSWSSFDYSPRVISCELQTMTLFASSQCFDTTMVYLRNKLGKSEFVLSFNMGWRILVFYPAAVSYRRWPYSHSTLLSNIFQNKIILS